MALWKNTDNRMLYVGSVINKLRMEGNTHIALEQLEQILKDAFKVEAAADYDSDFYLMTANKEYKIEGPFNYQDALSEADRMAERDQTDVLILQHYDCHYFVDF